MDQEALTKANFYTQAVLAKHRQADQEPTTTIVYLDHGDNNITQKLRQAKAKIAIYQNGQSLNSPYAFFLKVHKGLPQGGIFIGNFVQPAANQLSKAELLGTIAHAGFTIVDDKEFQNVLWLTAKKRGKPGRSTSIAGAKKLIFTQPRVGKDGKIIHVFKLRTMYPFAHLVQDYLFRKQSFGKMGKITHDYRITPWGKWLRRYWIDELPQIINIVKGEMTIMGLRPLSKGFLKALPRNLQKERTKYLPGLIPPIYADNPKNLEERIEAEWKYLRLKKNYGTLIDIVYFFRVIYAIIFTGQRGH